MTIAKDFASKFAVAFVAIAMIFSLVAPAVKAAETTEDLQKTINDLLAQVAALQSQMGGSTGGSSSASSCEAIPAPLTMGSKGANVTALQNRLIADGESIPAGATGFFGAQTKAALASWQGKNSVSPAVGYYGPLTAAAMAAACDEDATDEDEDEDDSSSDELSGEGTLDVFEMDDASDDSIEEGAEDSEIAEITVEATDGDIEIDRMTFTIVGQNTPTENDPWEVFDTISIWVDGDMVDEFDASDEDNYLDEDTGEFRFSGLGLVAMEDEEVEIVVAASVQGDVDGAGTDADWRLTATDVRYFDADGVASDDDTTDELPTAQANFEIVAEGEGDELTVRTSSEDPTATTIQLEDDKKTDYATVFAFNLDASDSDGDVEVNSLRVDVAATQDGTTGTSTTHLISDAQLVIDGEVYDDVTITHGVTGQFVFDIDGDVVVNAGEEATVEFQVEFKALAPRFEGATIKASAAGTNVDAEGADDITVDGSASGDEHTLRTAGAILETTETSETSKANTDATTADDEGVFKIEFEVTAFEDDLYIDDVAGRGTSMGTNGLNFLLTVGGTATTAGTAVATVDSSAELDGGRYLVEEGSTETFTLTVEFDPNVTGSYKLQLYSVNFNDTNAAPDTMQRALPAEDFETDSLTI